MAEGVAVTAVRGGWMWTAVFRPAESRFDTKKQRQMPTTSSSRHFAHWWKRLHMQSRRKKTAHTYVHIRTPGEDWLRIRRSELNRLPQTWKLKVGNIFHSHTERRLSILQPKQNLHR